MKTSLLWWLGFGMRLSIESGSFYIRKGYKKVYIHSVDLRSVRVERRALRGWTLVLETNSKTIYYRMSKRGARKAKFWLDAQKTHNS